MTTIKINEALEILEKIGIKGRSKGCIHSSIDACCSHKSCSDCVINKLKSEFLKHDTKTIDNEI